MNVVLIRGSHANGKKDLDAIRDTAIDLHWLDFEAVVISCHLGIGPVPFNETQSAFVRWLTVDARFLV